MASTVTLDSSQLGILIVALLVFSQVLLLAVKAGWDRLFGTRYVTEANCKRKHKDSETGYKKDLRAIKKMLARLCRAQGVSVEEFIEILECEE